MWPSGGRAFRTTSNSRSGLLPNKLHAVILVYLEIASLLISETLGIPGIKCMCDTHECRASGTDECSAKFYCYTQYQRSSSQESFVITARGCIDQKTPLLCEPFSGLSAKSVPGARRMVLNCCTDSWCNSRPASPPELPPDRRNSRENDNQDDSSMDNSGTTHRLTQQQQPQHRTGDGSGSLYEGDSSYRPNTKPIRRLNPIYIAVPVAAACVVLALVVFVIFLVKRREAMEEAALAAVVIAERQQRREQQLRLTQDMNFRLPLHQHLHQCPTVDCRNVYSAPHSPNSVYEQLLCKGELPSDDV